MQYSRGSITGAQQLQAQLQQKDVAGDPGVKPIEDSPGGGSGGSITADLPGPGDPGVKPIEDSPGGGGVKVRKSPDNSPGPESDNKKKQGSGDAFKIAGFNGYLVLVVVAAVIFGFNAK